MKTRTAANKRRSRFVGGGVRQLYPNFIFTESPSASEVIQTSFTEKTLHYLGVKNPRQQGGTLFVEFMTQIS